MVVFSVVLAASHELKNRHRKSSQGAIGSGVSNLLGGFLITFVSLTGYSSEGLFGFKEALHFCYLRAVVTN